MVRPLMRAKGWSNVVWSGADPVLMRNLWFIAVSRRAHFLHSKTARRIGTAGTPRNDACPDRAGCNWGSVHSEESN